MEKGTLYFFTGLAGAGKTTLGTIFYEHLRSRKPNVVLLDGDVVRSTWDTGVDYSTDARRASAFRLFQVCKVLTDQGIDVVSCSISMYDDVRQWNRENIPNYVEIYVRVTMDTLYRRDKKGLYNSDAPDVVGKDLPWDEPDCPQFIVQNDQGGTPQELIAALEQAIAQHAPKGTVIGLHSK